MSIRRLFFPLALVSLTSVVAIASAGCSVGSATGTCDAALDCGSLNQAQYEACLVDAQRYEITAEKTGCDAQFQAAVDCSDREGICSNGMYTAYTCDPEWQKFKACTGDD